MKPPTGWNTWDYRSYVTFVYLDKGDRRVRVRLAFHDSETLTTHEDFGWDAVERLGEHAWDGSYISVGLRVGDDVFDIEAAGDGPKLWGRVTPRQPTRKRVVVIVTPDGATSWVREKGRLVAGPYALSFKGAAHNDAIYLNINEPYVIGRPGGAVSFVCAPKRTKVDAGRVPAVLKEAAAACRSRSVTGTGALEHIPEGVVRAQTWNTLYDPYYAGLITAVTRTWCRHWGSVPVFDWDNAFAGVLAALESPELAWANLEAVCRAIDLVGFVPNFATSHGALSLDRSQPPVVSYCLWKVHCLAPNKAVLGACYPRLLEWHRWWFKKRDGNGDGLLEWGTDHDKTYEFTFVDRMLAQAGTKSDHQYAAFESGLDDSPMWDGVPYNRDTHTFELASTDLNSLYCLDCEYLAKIARECGDATTARALEREYAAMSARINDTLWSDEHGAYLNRYWDGRFSDVLTPVIFYPLLAGIAPPERADRLVNEHLLNPDEFWGEYVIPSVARNHPAFADNNYWRGRIWGSMNFLVAEGLARYRYDDVAYEYAKRGLGPFAKNWLERNRVHENYNAVTGAGGDVPNSEQLYHWGGLLGYIAIQQLVGVEPDGRLRFGNLSGEEAGVANVPVRGRRYSVHMAAKGMTVARDGRKLLSTNGAAILRGFDMQPRTICFDLFSKQPDVTITFFSLRPSATYAVVLSGTEFKAQADAKGTLRIEYSAAAST